MAQHTCATDNQHKEKKEALIYLTSRKWVQRGAKTFHLLDCHSRSEPGKKPLYGADSRKQNPACVIGASHLLLPHLKGASRGGLVIQKEENKTVDRKRGGREGIWYGISFSRPRDIFREFFFGGGGGSEQAAEEANYRICDNLCVLNRRFGSFVRGCSG